MLGLLFAFFSTILITDALKVSVGRPRPDFFIRCFPSGVPVYSSSGNVLCNGNPSVVSEGRKSFPSGHASVSFSGLAYLSFFLAAKLHSLSSSAAHLWRLLPPALPLVGGVAVGITRIDDYWHFPFDVFVGSLIGISFAAICYFIHYPSLRHDYCHLPRDLVKSDVSRRAVLDDNVDSSLDVPTNGDGSAPCVRPNREFAGEPGDGDGDGDVESDRKPVVRTKLEPSGEASSSSLGNGAIVPVGSARSNAEDLAAFEPVSVWGNSSLEEADPDIWRLIQGEKRRQRCCLELIASENFTSQAVLEALGSPMTNKYSEGMPGARYYGGNQWIDAVENLCRERALAAFHLDPQRWGVNVQPYSCTSANFAVYTALLTPGDRIMGLDLPSGGHLSHGFYTNGGKKVSGASIYFETLPYKVNPVTGIIDYERMEEKAQEYRPRLLVVGGSAYPREWDFARCRRIADKCGAILMCDMAHISGLVAAQECNSPFDFADVVTSTTHKTLRGPRGGLVFYRRGPIVFPRSAAAASATMGTAGAGGGEAARNSGGASAAGANTDRINFAVFPSMQGGPHNNHTAALAVSLKQAASPAFRAYMIQVKRNARALAAALARRGCRIVTGGTDNHLLLWDLRPLGLTGGRFEKVCEACSITLNKNAVFGDNSALPGGVRIGTPAMTTRGCKEADMDRIADFLVRAVQIAQRSLHSQRLQLSLSPAPAAASASPASGMLSVDVTLVAHIVQQTRMRLKTRYSLRDPAHHFGSGDKMQLPEFIQRHGTKDKREMKAEGVDGDGNPVTFEFTLHERPLPGHETEGDVTACVELSIKYVRAIDKEREWRMRDLELLEGSKLFRTASYVSDDTKRLETFKKWLGQLHKLYHHKLPGKPSVALAHVMMFVVAFMPDMRLTIAHPAYCGLLD
ncbi:unnamed protein product [Closterium sp. Yama58-4]|nr:unnamed protein product [Closterium sp. Yama58-4]